jgi:DNA uptake protein ComE-like DNA-binding protein
VPRKKAAPHGEDAALPPKPQGEERETYGYTARGRAWEWQQSWFLLFFFTYFLYWAPLLYMGLRVLQFRWIVYSGIYALPTALYALVRWAAFYADADAVAAYSSVLSYLLRSLLPFWVVAGIHTWRARGEFLLRVADIDEERQALLAAAHARREPAEAEPGHAPAPHRHLDLNKIGEHELAMLPGLGPEHARQAVQLRAEHGGFRSFGEFADLLQLPAESRARLRSLFESAEAAPEAAIIAPGDPAYRELADGNRVLELNWASVETLGALPGIGPDTARRAVTLRDGDGPFKSLEDFRFRLGLTMDVIIKISPFVSVVSMSRGPGGGTKTSGRIVDA